MLHKDMKVMIHSSDDATDYFDIIARFLVLFLFIIYQYYELRTSVDLMK